MISTTKPVTISKKIIDLLSKGDLLTHEMKEALNVGYSELWEALRKLKREGKISQYFRPTPPSATACFCLSGKRKIPLSIQWGRGIKPWTPPARPR